MQGWLSLDREEPLCPYSGADAVVGFVDDTVIYRQNAETVHSGNMVN